MATVGRYDGFRAEDLIGRPLEDGQYIAYGTSPNAVAGQPSTNIVSNVMPSEFATAYQGRVAPQPPAMNFPDIQRSSMDSINIPNVARPTEDVSINPLGLPMSETQAMLRRQALRGEGMSVAQQKNLQGQIAGEAGQIAAANRAAAEAKAIKDAKDFELAKRGQLVGEGGETAREREIRLKAELQGNLATAKQQWQTAENEKKIAATSKNLDTKIAADEKARTAMLSYRAQEARAQGKNVFTPEWEAKMRAELIQQGNKDTVAINRDIFKVQESMLEAAAKDGSITFAEARKTANELEARLLQSQPNLSATILPTAPQGQPQGNADANKNGIPDSLESDYNQLDAALRAAKEAPTPDAARILKLQNAMKTIKDKLIPKG